MKTKALIIDFLPTILFIGALSFGLWIFRKKSFKVARTILLLVLLVIILIFGMYPIMFIGAMFYTQFSFWSLLPLAISLGWLFAVYLVTKEIVITIRKPRSNG